MHDCAVEWYLDNARRERDGGSDDVRFPIRMWDRMRYRSGPSAVIDVVTITDHAISAQNSSRSTSVSLMRACNFCGAANAVMKCTGCHVARYCDEVCQADDWERHRPTCAPRTPERLRVQLA